MPLTDWSADLAAEQAKKNAIILLYGTPKTGKTGLGTSTKLPWYGVHLDPNNNLNEHLLARHRLYPDAYTAQPLYIPTLPYSALTKELCQGWIEQIQQYAADARRRAEDRGESGVFLIDGGKRLRGYIEKWLLGESTTLGFRAEAGQSGGPIQVEYAKSNAFFNDLINSFVGSPLHVVLTFEAREKWVLTQDDRGRKTRQPSGKYEPKMSGGKDNEIAYTINALIETLVEAVPGPVVDNKQTTNYVHKIRFDYVGFVGMDYLRGRTMPTPTFDDLLALLHSQIPAEQVLDEPHEVQRMDMSGLADAEEE